MTTPTIDGTPVEDHATWHGNGTGGVQIATGVTTTVAGLLVAVLGCNRATAVANITGITSTSGLTWTKRTKQSETGANHDTIEIWTAPTSGAVTAEKITVTTDVNVNAGTMCLFGIKDFATAKFDNNAGLPFHNTATGTGNPVVTYSTTQANDLLIFSQAGDKSAAGTAVTGFTTIINNTNGAGAGAFFGMSVCWKAVTSAQSSVSTSGQTGNATANAVSLVDAFTNDNPNRTLAIDVNSYTISAQAVAGLVGRKSIIGANSYVVTPQSLTFRATRGILLGNQAYVITPQNINFPAHIHFLIDSTPYLVVPQDVVLTPNFKQHFSFAELSRGDFKDWGSDDFDSFLTVNDKGSDPDVRSNIRYLYTFLKQTDLSTIDTEGALVNFAWDWRDPTETVPRVTLPSQVYNFRNGYLVGASRQKIRGLGRVFQSHWKNDGNKDFNILGWVVFIDSNNGL